ncbi:hypothetical protein kpv48_28 [Klebsiella phage vB_KpnP_KpV48]|uniref:Uncharacterized protein n=1 Tax=Klebsiella phage vB_KpnP_KpV48 TaxID=1912319 RepID=A0A1I9SEF9_9CAUD|nr:hypothetical protein HOR34_gp28 [Klebsiella phage vB_KpnP_KpV48]AOZ65236.1 hypothetical protein kpv48_28 [Klebsiella phage vB_KpnP_KpV48]
MGVRVEVHAPRHSFMVPYAEHACNRWYVSFIREDDPCTMYVVRWAAKPTRKQVKLAAKSVARLEI